ncbi:MAG: hypothetical protein ABSG70_07665 [Terriglobales bacterium]|jgi:hypothetical protein
MSHRRSVLETYAAGSARPTFFLRLAVFAPTVLILLATFAVASVAQDTPKQPTQPGQQSSKPPDQGGQEGAKPPETLAHQVTDAAKMPVEMLNLLDRKSIVFPDIAASTQKLTTGQKFQLFVDNSVSVHTVLWSVVGSAVGQASNSPTGWGQGWGAYGDRFGSSLARGASGEFFGTFILASALHQDPRFFPQRHPGFGKGVKYSIQRVFVTRTDDGRNQANWSGLAGPLLGEGLANAYWPDRNRTVGDTFFRYGLDIATRIGGNLMREYWPIVSKKLERSGSSTRH